MRHRKADHLAESFFGGDITSPQYDADDDECGKGVEKGQSISPCQQTGVVQRSVVAAFVANTRHDFFSVATFCVSTYRGDPKHAVHEADFSYQDPDLFYPDRAPFFTTLICNHQKALKTPISNSHVDIRHAF